MQRSKPDCQTGRRTPTALVLLRACLSAHRSLPCPAHPPYAAPLPPLRCVMSAEPPAAAAAATSSTEASAATDSAQQAALPTTGNDAQQPQTNGDSGAAQQSGNAAAEALVAGGETAVDPAAPAVKPSATEPSAAAPSADATPAADASAPAGEDGSRKRRSRWAPAPAVPAAAAAAGAEGGDLDENGQPRKRSRWSKAPAAVVDPAAAVLAALTPEQIEAFKVQLRIDEITRALMDPTAALRADEAAREAAGQRGRSPSPEPLYDSSGVRTNTRPVRFAVKLEKERQQLVEALQKLNPSYRPPAGFRKIRYERRLLIPIKVRQQADCCAFALRLQTRCSDSAVCLPTSLLVCLVLLSLFCLCRSTLTTTSSA